MTYGWESMQSSQKSAAIFSQALIQPVRLEREARWAAFPISAPGNELLGLSFVEFLCANGSAWFVQGHNIYVTIKQKEP
jgi:hypothetical protein